MKRAFSAAPCAALAALCLAAAALPAAAERIEPVPAAAPRFLAPALFEGFEPIPPDRFGLSPAFQYFVFQDGFGLHVIRLFDLVEVFVDRVAANAEVGFDPSDRRLFLTERRGGGGARFRLIDPDTGQVLLDERLPGDPEIRTNLNASVNLIVLRDASRARILAFDRWGSVLHRRVASVLVRFGLNLFAPAVAFVDPVSDSTFRVEVVGLETGRILFRETAGPVLEAGFEPQGPAFVLARATGRESFRVRLVDTETGRQLLNRSFSGILNVGFTPDSSLVGVRDVRGLRERLFLFGTRDGRQLPLPGKFF